MAEADADSLLDLLRPVLASALHPDRRLGRALAFLTLYEVDQAHHAPAPVLERLSESAGRGNGDAAYPAEVVREATDYAREIVRGALTHRAEIDQLIQDRAPAWPISQMSAIDRNVLRVGLYESLFGNAKVPVRAAINEAVELAKLFGSETSAKFVNGVLGRAVEPNRAPPETSPGQPT